LTEQQKINQIADFNKQIAMLKEQVNKNTAEARIYADKRDSLHEQLKNHRNNIQAFENQRDSLNEKVKTLKLERDAAHARKKDIMEEIITRRKNLTELKKKKLRKNRNQIEKEIHEIEWQIQTTSLNLQEEKILVEKVKQLEPQLNIYKKIEHQNKKIAELRNEEKTLNLCRDLGKRVSETLMHQA